MVFSDNTYSVLVVSRGEKFNNEISGLLPVGRYYPVIFVPDTEEARGLFFGRPFDIVIINASNPYESSIELAMDICDRSEAGVILLASAEAYEDIYYRTVSAGVMTVSKPISRSGFLQSMGLVCAICERMKNFVNKQTTVEEKIDEMRVVNKAKWMLIDHAHMTEPDAHRFIERKAMDERITKRAVAERIIAQYS